MPFDTAAAKKAGYSDAEIADHLAQDSKFDAAAARKAGYSDSEIVSHLAGEEQKPYTVAGEIGGAFDRLKSDIKTAYAPQSPQERAQRPVGVSRLTPQPGQASPRLSAVDRIGGDVRDLALSPITGAINKFVNKPLSKATGIPEQDIQAVEYAGSLALGNRLGRAPEPKIGPRPKPVPRPAVPSLDELRTAKSAAYDAVDKAGVTYKPEAFGAAVDSMSAELRGANINAKRHPLAASMLEDIHAMKGQAPSITEIDQLRQVIQRDVVSKGGAEKFFGRKMIDQLDKFVETAGPEAVNAGDPAAASAMLKTARELNGRYRKVEAVTTAVEKARLQAGSTGSGGNVDNAIRQKLRGVMEKTPNLRPAERNALETAVIGTKGQNTLRQVGKLSPQGNGLMLGLHTGASVFGGPVGAIPGLAGLVSKHVADGMTKTNVENIIRLMATGGEAEARQINALAARDAKVGALVQDLRRARVAAPANAFTAATAQGSPSPSQTESGRR